MASYGLIVRNGDKRLMIDSAQLNLCLIAKGSTTTTAAYGSQMSIRTLAVSNVNCPVVACSSPNGGYGFINQRSGSNAIVNLVGMGAAGIPITYYLFDTPSQLTTPLPAYGLIVRNVAKQLCYRSDMKPMIVVEPGASWPTNRKYAIITSSVRAEGVFHPLLPGVYPGTFVETHYATAISATNQPTTVNKVRAETTVYGPPTPPNWSTGGAGFVVDVTGY